ncbi:energy-coupling factor transporter transmembrane protein EcfT [Facklamia sp. DSM 111018]|uniref:Energy-coupling factor transporter transmembrane protein EcfT n=1 Tax=Facklamia lactis TaxID=2749967 RepID=A0ABS0LQK6_9LACT|nr:energy-coupling factor transporter transmembrane component T [Facklamia lactis]MBG9980623.1 energy-coupling factor transporter transmembrane protein EcfT [Facklamia lactis]MBG9986437.1 energy-coupling factor transporter transmembrane protein EcfT [Facklamia lactis]
MSDKILMGRYIQLESVIHQLDPRTKLMATFYFILIVFLADNLLAYGVLLGLILLAVFLSDIPIGFFLNGLKPMFWIIFFTVIFQVLFTQGGTVYFQLGPMMITSLGLMNGLYIFLRLFLIIMMSTILTLTTAPLELTDGIEHLMRPLTKLGFPSHEVALMLSIALRYVPTLLDEAQTIMNAQRARGVEFDEGSIMDRMKAIIPILVPLFISAFNRAEELATAMEARGYQGAEGRTKYRQLAYGKNDLFALTLLGIVTVLILFLRFY